MVRPSLKEKRQNEIIKSAGIQIMVSECCRSERLAIAPTPCLLHPRAWPVSTPVSSGKQLSGVKSMALNSHASTQISPRASCGEKPVPTPPPHLTEGREGDSKEKTSQQILHSLSLSAFTRGKNKRRGKEEKIRFNQPM